MNNTWINIEIDRRQVEDFNIDFDISGQVYMQEVGLKELDALDLNPDEAMGVIE